MRELLLYYTFNLEKIKETSTLKTSFVLLTTVWLSVLISLFNIFNLRATFDDFILFYFTSFLMALILILLYSMWIHFFSELFGKQGNVKQMLSSLAHVFLPFHLLLPASFIVSKIWYLRLFIFLSLWCMVLSYFTVKEHYRLSTIKTFYIGLSPWILFSFFLSALSMFITSLLFGNFSSILSYLNKAF